MSHICKLIINIWPQILFILLSLYDYEGVYRQVWNGNLLRWLRVDREQPRHYQDQYRKRKMSANSCFQIISPRSPEKDLYKQDAIHRIQNSVELQRSIAEWAILPSIASVTENDAKMHLMAKLVKDRSSFCHNENLRLTICRWGCCY
jgi:hypothetical protein